MTDNKEERFPTDVLLQEVQNIGIKVSNFLKTMEEVGYSAQEAGEILLDGMDKSLSVNAPYTFTRAEDIVINCRHYVVAVKETPTEDGYSHVEVGLGEDLTPDEAYTYVAMLGISAHNHLKERYETAAIMQAAYEATELLQDMTDRMLEDSEEYKGGPKWRKHLPRQS